MVAIVQGFQFDQDLLSQLFILLEGDLLESNDLLGGAMDGFLDDSTSSLAQHLIGDKILDAHLYSTLS